MKINTLLTNLVFAIYIAITFLSCKEKEIIPTPPDSNDFYFIATVNEKSKNLVSGRNGYRSTVTTEQVTGNNPALINLIYTSGLSQLNNNYYIKSSEIGSVKFDNDWFNASDYSSNPNLYFSNVFSAGSRNFCNMTDSATPCVEIYWKDTYAKEWTTRKNSQSGSLFNITSVTESTGTSGETLKLVKATFNCTLYNELGASIVLKNGQFFLIFKRA